MKYSHCSSILLFSVASLCSFVKARAELAIEDLELLVKRALDILLASSDNLFVQVKYTDDMFCFLVAAMHINIALHCMLR